MKPTPRIWFSARSWGLATIRPPKHRMRLQMEAQSGQRHKNREKITDEKSEPYEREIHGSPAHFKILSGKNAAGAEVHEVEGDFQGTKGPALLMLRAHADDLSSEALKQMLDSMK